MDPLTELVIDKNVDLLDFNIIILCLHKIWRKKCFIWDLSIFVLFSHTFRRISPRLIFIPQSKIYHNSTEKIRNGIPTIIYRTKSHDPTVIPYFATFMSFCRVAPSTAIVRFELNFHHSKHNTETTRDHIN